MPSPVKLYAGVKYRIGCYAGSGAAASGAPGSFALNQYFWRNDGVTNFASGVIDQGYEVFGDGFPLFADSLRWILVDLKYSTTSPITVPIDIQSGNFTNGIWTGYLTVQGLATNLVIVANDGDGHTWFNCTFARIYRDDAGNWQRADSFGKSDLPLLIKVADRCHDWMFEQAKTDE